MRRMLFVILALIIDIINASDLIGSKNYIDKVMDISNIPYSQKEIFNNFYQTTYEFAVKEYGLMHAEKGTACIIAFIAAFHSHPEYVYKNFKFKPQKELVNFLNVGCNTKKHHEVLDRINTTIKLYHNVLSDGTNNVNIKAE